MKRPLRVFLSALLIVAALLAADAATAQPHMEPTLEDVTVPTPTPDVWLRRLVGNFKLDGAIKLGPCESGNCAAITGKIDCIAVGDGPGVQCVINAKWPFRSAFLDPAMSLFGLDPGRSAINLLLINDRGLPTGGFGDVKGHFTAFKTRCPGANEDGCQIGIRIEAKPDANINYMWIGPDFVIAMRRVPPEKAAGIDERLREVTSEESEEEIARAEEDAREESEALALEPKVVASTVLQASGTLSPVLDALDEIVAEGERERQRQAQAPREIWDPDKVTVTRNDTKTGDGSIRVRIQPRNSYGEMRFRASDARQLADGAGPAMKLQRDRLTTGDKSLIRNVTLEFTAGLDETDGLPALIPFSATTSLFNIDYARLRNSAQPQMATLRNVMNPETRRCTSALNLGDGAEDFHDRFILLGNRFGDCDRVVKSREGDLVFADAVPQRLRQELHDLYDPVYNQFARDLGSEPGIVFVIWRPESPRNDFRLVRSLNRTNLLVFNGPSWEHGFTAQQRDALWDEVAQEQILRRIPGPEEPDALTEAATGYLLKLARAKRQHTTSRWLTTEVPEWIAACGRAMNLRMSATNVPRGLSSYECGLVMQFVYDAVARAKSRGEDSVMRTWRTLLADAYRRGQHIVQPSAFVDSSADARRIVQGMLNGVVDWTAFAGELGKLGVQLLVIPGQVAPSVQVQSLANFRD